MRAISLLPGALAAFYVVGLWLETGISPFAVARTLVLAVAGASALWALACLALRDRGKGTYVASVVTGVALFAGSVAGLALAAAALLGTLGTDWLIARRGRSDGWVPWARLTWTSNRLSLVVALATMLAVGQSSGSLVRVPADVGDALDLRARSALAAAPTSTPDIYMIVLEDHMRADTLARRFQVDSAPFDDQLAALGFRVAPLSRSNYSNTLFSLASLFQMRHLDAIPELQGLLAGVGNSQPLMRSLIDDAPAFSILRAHGYEIVAVSAGFEEVTLRGADRFLDGGQVNDFETYVLHATPVGSVVEASDPAFYGDQLRARVRSSFADLASLARERVDHPRFVFVHLQPPHGPIVFGRHGEPVFAPLGDPYGFDTSDGWEAFSQRYVDQLTYVHELTIAALGDLVAQAKRPFVAILMSEEGSRFVLDWQTQEGRQDAVSNLFAARMPDGEDPFGPTITLVNVLPLLLDRYLGEAIPRQADRSLISDPEEPFHLVEIADPGAAAP